MKISKTPKPPYYAVIFSSLEASEDKGYYEMASKMEELAQQQLGYLGFESARASGLGISISYWSSLEAIKNWKNNSDHLFAQEQGREIWYQSYKTRICKVERDYEYEKE